MWPCIVKCVVLKPFPPSGSLAIYSSICTYETKVPVYLLVPSLGHFASDQDFGKYLGSTLFEKSYGTSHQMTKISHVQSLGDINCELGLNWSSYLVRLP